MQQELFLTIVGGLASLLTQYLKTKTSLSPLFVLALLSLAFGFVAYVLQLIGYLDQIFSLALGAFTFGVAIYEVLKPHLHYPLTSPKDMLE